MNNVSKKTRKQSTEQKKNQIERSKARYKAKSTGQKPINSAPSPVKLEDLQKEKRIRKKVQKQAKNLQKYLDQTKQTIINQNKNIRGLEDRIAKLEYERFETNQNVSNMEKQFEIEIRKKDEFVVHEQNLRREAENKARTLITQQQKNQSGIKSKVNLANQVTQLKNSNKSLRKQLENYDLLNQEKYENLRNEVKSLRKEVHIFRDREARIKKDPLFLVNYMKSHITENYIPELIDLLQNQVTRKNLPFFYRGNQNVFYLLMRRVNLLNFHAHKHENPYKLKNKTNSNEMQRLGYLVCANEKWQFVDVTQTTSSKMYNVLENHSDVSLTADQPVKARIQQNGVIITKCFPMEAPKKKQFQNKKRHTNTSGSQKDYLWFGNFNVLVIGSRFLSEYKDRLATHGCKVEEHNPFEESYEVLAGKVNRAEIILVCERHIPHSIWDHVDKKQPYVSILKKDSKDLISTFTYLTLQRCELI